MPFRIALSGLNAASSDLKATGNNIANAGTTGFKSSRTEFVDVFAVGYGGISSTAIGGGVRLASVKQEFSQGNVDFTNNNLDLAINGQGFFVVNDAGARLFSRAGAFSADRDGFVVNNTGQRLQVFPATTSSAGTRYDTGRLTDLQLATAEGAPNATTQITSVLNLDASASAPTTPFALVNPSQTPDGYNSSTSLTVYDSLGSPHQMTQYYRKTATANQWEVYLYKANPDGTETQVTPSAPAANISGSAFLISFNQNGQLISPVAGATTALGELAFNPVSTADLGTGAAPLPISLDLDSLTQFGSPFAVSALSQDGFASGRLSGIDISDEGVISARYTNGQSQIMGKVALANVANPGGLSPQGDTIWGETFSAGDVILGEAGTSSFGLIQSGALESSNVDVAAQLVNLITAQRNFQANAQVISTADTVTQTIINIR